MFSETVITAKDVAELLHKSLKWVYTHSGELGGVRIGRSVIFTEESLAAALDAVRSRAQEELEDRNVCKAQFTSRKRRIERRKRPTYLPGGEDPHGLMPKWCKPPSGSSPGSTIRG